MWKKLGRSLRSRIFFSVAIFVVIPLIAVMGIIWKKTNDQMLQRQIETYKENILYMSRLCDSIFDDIKSQSLLIYNDEKIMEILKKGEEMSEEEQKLLNSKISTIFYSSDDIESLAFYVEKLNLIIYRKRNESNRFYRIQDETELANYFVNEIESEEIQYRINAIKNKESHEFETILHQNILDLDYKPLAHIEIIYNQGIFDPLFSLPEKDGTTGNFVFDDKGQLLYEENKEEFSEELMKTIRDSAQGVSYQDENNPYVIIKQSMEEFPYDVVKCISLQGVMDELAPYRNGLVVVFLLVFVIIAVLALILSGLVRKPIKRFTQSIVHFRNSRENIVPKVQPEIQEMEELAEEFSGMMREINQLIEEKSEARYKEKKAYLMMLTVQINPHFLYNALQTLQLMALKRKAFEINAMLISLGKILRYSLNWQQGEVSLETELENALEYLNIQKFRYVDELELQTELPEEMPDCMIPKMVLQPLVENCFVHGFKGKTGEFRIRLSVYREKGRIYIEVSDNGKGMEKNAVEDMNYRMESGEYDPASEHTGLLSVNYRLKEKYPRSSIRIEQGQWFCVRITILGGCDEVSDY